jgi:putative ABC transport system permease protein
MRDDDLDDELRTHLEMETEERIAAGMTRADAEASARRAFGNLTLVKEITREMWGCRSLERLAHDLRYALRLLQRNPGFTLAVVLSIALGVGAETAIFSVVNAVVLRPLAFPNADRLVAIAEHPSGDTRDRAEVSGPDFADFHDQNRSFEHLAAFLTFTFPLTDENDAILVRCTGISPDFFDALGIRPVIGRVYSPEQYRDDGPGIIISYGFWQRHFGGDPGVVGKTIHLNHAATPIVGVMSQTGDLFTETDIWATYSPKYIWAQQRDNRFLSLIGLLRPGVSVAQAREDLQAIYRHEPGVAAQATIELEPLKDSIVGGVRNALLALLAAVGLVLLIACANVANLLLARGAARRQEIATRYALGASRGRLIRQFLTESLLLSGIGGVAGVLLAYEMVRVLLALNPAFLPRAGAIGFDLPVLLFALAISLASGSIFSVAPVLAASRDALHQLVRARGMANPADRWTRGALVATELGLAVILLTGAGLLGRSLWRVLNVSPGFRAEHVLTLRLRVPDNRVATPFYPELLQRVAQRPGIEAAAVSDCMPTGFLAGADLLIPGRASDPLNVPAADACFISSNYFRALGIPLVAGRAFGEMDGAATQPVVVISESVARQLWPTESALGRQVAVNYRSLGRPTEDAPATRTVVGVVADVRHRGLETPSRMAVYLPYQQDATRRSLRSMVLFARTTGDPASIAHSVQDDVRALGPDVPVVAAISLQDALHQGIAPRTFSLVLLATFAGCALLLAAAGLYGVVSYAVARRAREIGIRMALGARKAAVLKTVLWQELRWLAVGLAAGLAGSWGVAQLLRGMLFGIGPADPSTFVAVVVVLGLVALAACWNPARRAVSMDPLAVLRDE